jgi:hypothetical protein
MRAKRLCGEILLHVALRALLYSADFPANFNLLLASLNCDPPGEVVALLRLGGTRRAVSCSSPQGS